MQQAPAPVPTAQGTFVKTPFPHLLVYALERGLSGTFELTVEGASVATLLVTQGAPAKLRTLDAVHFLGDVMLELGLVAPDAHAAALARMQESPRLYGEILKELGAADDARLEAGVRAQLERKVEHLFALPADTVFSYFDHADFLARYGGPATAVDPLPVIWRGVRQAPAWEHVDATLRRVGSAAVRIAPTAQIERFQLTRAELSAVELLRQRPMRVVDLANAKVVGPSVAQLLVYVLVITKQVDLVEVASVRPAQQPAGAGAPPGSGAAGAASPSPSSTGRIAAYAGPNTPRGESGPTSGQAFARVQLQAKQVARQPLVVEEAPVARSSADNRIASPVPQAIPLGDDSRYSAEALGSMAPIIPGAPPAPVIAGMEGVSPAAPPAALSGLDIGSLITTTIQSSMPPPVHHTPDAPFAPQPLSAAPPPLSAPPSSGPGSAPPVSAPASAPLTAEQTSLKQKILDRAAAISGQDYFQMLGLDRSASTEQVQKSFIALAKVWHPDRLPAALVDVKDACSRVFTHLTEAHATLTDPERRNEYMTLLKDGGATPDDQAKIQAVLEAATEFQKAEIFLKRNDVAQAYELAKKSHTLDPEQADYLAMVTWIEALRPEFSGREKTLEKIAVLDRCLKMNANCERAYFWRGMLYKRIDETSKAMKDFKKAGELNPRNLDAMREVRLHNIRGGTKPPPGPGGGGGGRPSTKPPQPETLGGLFGKLFKK